MKENHQSYKGGGELIVTPHLANISYNSLAPRVIPSSREDRKGDGGHV